ncbi:MAG: minichromosome maintenance protein MCM, partial [Candidatus ainarchaeum sp.]|nr:minichromosome maintenance protein MCM [Candidatus ainarchaeum sp.]
MAEEEKKVEKQEEQEFFNEPITNPHIEKFDYFLNLKYSKEIEKLNDKERILRIDFKSLEEYDPYLADELVKKPDKCIDAIKYCINKKISLFAENKDLEPIVSVYNLPQEHKMFIKHINAENIDNLIGVEGIVRQFTTILPKLKVAHWLCKRCGYEFNIDVKHEIETPTACPECRHKFLSLIENKSIFIDYQKLEIQEPLEVLKGGEQSGTLVVSVTDSLVGKVGAGDRIVVTGVMRLVPPQKKQSVYGRYLECFDIEETKQDYEDIEIDEENLEQIKAYSENPEIYEILVNSIAPNIFGHDIIKESIALQLFGGVKKHMEDGSKTRGNIHILLIGDPGVGKSKLLLYASNVAPKSLYVVGKTASGAGLTASAVKDEFGEGGWTLKAGALVLASGGFAMIDEFDKMNPEDRSAMHEAMEQETVSIAKAGIVSNFKTETSILAAANPKYGRFDQYKTIPEQIEIPPTLMSRFDLFFSIKDLLDEKKDRETVMSILKGHKTGELLSRMKQTDLVKKDRDYLEKSSKPQINPDLLKKYISYARTKIFPILSDKAMDRLGKFFIDLRKKSKDGRVTVTYRQLEALIRLSEASARVRLAPTVEIDDAERAIKLFRTSMEQVGMDPETGDMDIDIISTGQSHSQAVQMRNMLEVIKDWCKEHDSINLHKLMSEAEAKKIDKTKVQDYVSKLLRAGDVYEPKP